MADIIAGKKQRWHPKKCRGCGRTADQVHISARGWCADCAVRRAAGNIVSAHAVASVMRRADSIIADVELGLTNGDAEAGE